MSIPREHQWSDDRSLARQQIKQWRRHLDDVDFENISESIRRHVDQWLTTWLTEFCGVNNCSPVLAVFWPIQREPDLRPMFERWREAGFVLALPVTPSAPGPLQFARLDIDAQMQADAAGIAVPASPVWVRPDVMLIPCLGFDGRGYRLGYGGGYFDRTLPGYDSVNLGIAYQESDLPQFVAGNHDRPLDQIITERGPVLR